jgi:hypothetical protein
MVTKIGESSYEGQPAYILESERATVIVLPRISGKIASLVDESTGRELLWRNPERGYQEPMYGSGWAEYDMSGWEDCIPTVAASEYPEPPWEGIPLPEHGEVWALPWDARATDEAVELIIHGVRLPYRFEKSISIEGNGVCLHHRLVNPSAFPIRYIWATHPLFDVRPGTHIVLPKVTSVLLDWSRNDRLGSYLDELSWPVAQDTQGRPVQLDRIGESQLGYADKLYTSQVTEGWCGLYDPENGNAVVLTFDARQLPYVGVWINQGGYPVDGVPCYNVALEPTCGYPDLLDVACSQGAAATIAPGQQQEWTVDLLFGSVGSVESLLGDLQP